MSTEDIAENSPDQDDGFELDSETSDDLESAMQEALEAVEKASSEVETSARGDRPSQAASIVAEASGSDDVSMLKAELSELKDRSLRTVADFDNFRKRVERERNEERRYATADILKEFLKIIDNLERAVASGGGESEYREGVELILRQMHELLRNSAVSRIEATGVEFDPRYHEAVSKHESDSVDQPTVSEEMQAGYLLHDRLLRPSIVKVAMPIRTEQSPLESPPEDKEE